MQRRLPINFLPFGAQQRCRIKANIGFFDGIGAPNGVINLVAEAFARGGAIKAPVMFFQKVFLGYPSAAPKGALRARTRS